MTVKELDRTLGMSRANIRFYEKEGLLSPLRLERGGARFQSVEADALPTVSHPWRWPTGP